MRRKVLNTTPSLDYQILRMGFYSAILGLVSGVISIFLPLHIPAGAAAEHADRVVWLVANKGVFIAGWANQIFGMLCLSGVLLAAAWLIRAKNPLRALLAAGVVLMSTVAYLIPKFTAVWAIPQLADTLASGATGAAAEMADPLLRVLNGSINFSLYGSLENLGFWMNAVFALLVMVPLYRCDSLAAKASAIVLAVIGIAYHGLMLAFLTGSAEMTEIGGYLSMTFMLLLPAIVALAFTLKGAMASAAR
jgi:hypothetical protein